MSRLDRHDLVSVAARHLGGGGRRNRRGGLQPETVGPSDREKSRYGDKLADVFFSGAERDAPIFAYCIASASTGAESGASAAELVAAAVEEEVGKEGASQLRFPIYIHDRWQ